MNFAKYSADVSKAVVSVPGVAKQSPWILISSLLVGVGSWGQEHIKTWSAFTTPEHVFSLAGVVGAVLIGYFGGRPAKQPPQPPQGG